ncbi:MAG: HU family DNA-binding protein [Muribaculaceae bacterium]|nr:HU family DNA-binding protein [Muribaculaceae bacterium]
MNSKITILKLAQLLALKTGAGVEDCETVVRILFREIAGSLQTGEAVRVKGLGTFKILKVEARKSVDVNSGENNEIPAHKRISFIPAREMAAAINAPFEMFETVVLDERVSEDLLNQAEETVIQLPEDPIQFTQPEMTTVTFPDVTTETDPNDLLIPECTEDGLSDNDNEIVDKTECNPSEVEEEYQYNNEETPEDKKHRIRWWYMTACIIILLIAAGGVWMFDTDRNIFGLIERENRHPAAADSIVTDSILPPDIHHSIVAQHPTDNPDKQDDASTSLSTNTDTTYPVANDPVPTKASDTPVYDVVTDTRYLSTIAKEHYGNFNLWPYIYKENEKILGHPNRIRPGTRIIVPPLSKYGVDPKNKSHIEKAKQLGAQIYQSYSNQ